jgi:hypothetical protein
MWVLVIISSDWEQWLTPVIPATLEAEIGRNEIGELPWQKVSETPISTNSWVWVSTCYVGDVNRRIEVQVGPDTDK